MTRWEPTPDRPSLSRKQRVVVFMSTDGCCYKCGQKLRGDAWEAEHPQARELGGSDAIEDLRPICIPCHKPKTAKDKAVIAKVKRIRDKHIGATVKSRSSFSTNRDSKWKKKMNGKVELR